jgi:hypothetical protein
VLTVICIAILAFGVGMTYGRWTVIHSLLLGVDKPSRTPHCINGRFYYIVPEIEYVDSFLDMLKTSKVGKDERIS